MTLESHGGLSYTDSLARALDVEAVMPGEKSVTAPAPPQPQFEHHGKKRKWEANQGDGGGKNSWQGPPHPRGFQKPTNPRQKGNFPQIPTPCPDCNKGHEGLCKAGINGCYTCGQQGHYASGCPSKRQRMGVRSNRSGQSQQLRAMQAPQGLQQQHNAQGYAMRKKQFTNQGNLVGTS